MSETPSRPLRVGPSPTVLAAIRREMKKRKLTGNDRRMPSVVISLAAEPVGARGLNQGIFYPETELPAHAAAMAPSLAVRSRPTTGTLRILVLLVDFSDNRGNRPAEDVRAMLFARGTYPSGSMYDFYRENSYDQLQVDGEVVGWLRLPHPYAYYVNGESGTSDTHYPHNAQKMVEDALAEAVKTVDLSRFDADGDKFVDGLFVVHAGPGAEADPDQTTRATKIWSHQWNISQPFRSNGVTAYAYLTVPEDSRVGVCCHEFGHMLGLPDLYDTTYASEGVGVWCVMGAGSWNNGGLTPGHFCAWSKARLKWLKPTVVKAAKTVSLPPVERAKPVVYRLWTNGKSGSEYFLLEHRARTGFDAKLPAAGLLIWRVDDANHDNDHPGDYWVGLLQADGRRDLELGRNRGDAGDPYPGSGKKRAIDDTTTPNTRDHLGKATGVAVTNIALKRGTVSCRVRV